MTTQAFTQGTAFGIAPVLSTVSTLIGNVVAIDTAPEMSRTPIETTNSASTGGWKTFVPGDIKDGGTLAITWQYNTQVDYGSLFASGGDTITITFPKRATTIGGSLASVAATWSATVIFEKLSPKWEFDSQIVMTGTFRVSGVPTYVAAVA